LVSASGALSLISEKKKVACAQTQNQSCSVRQLATHPAWSATGIDATMRKPLLSTAHLGRHNQARGKRYATANKRKPTKAERACAAIFDELGVWYKAQAYFYDANTLYLPDFRLACSWHKVIVEVDGSFHDGREAYDERRTSWMEANRNCKVTRFTNEDVLERPDLIREWVRGHQPPLLLKADADRGAPKRPRRVDAKQAEHAA